jgi:hypothetical protein
MTRGDLGAKFIQSKDGVLQCQAWAEITVLLKVGDFIQSLEHNLVDSLIENRTNITQNYSQIESLSEDEPILLEIDLDGFMHRGNFYEISI